MLALLDGLTSKLRYVSVVGVCVGGCSMISMIMIIRGNSHTEPTSGEGICAARMNNHEELGKWIQTYSSYASLQNAGISALTQLEMYCREIIGHYSGSGL